MPSFLNHVAIAAPRNGTTTHSVDPSSVAVTGGSVVAGALFTPTAGRRLVLLIEGSVTSTTPSGWTLPSNGSAINNTGLYVMHRVAAGADTISTTHNGSNYPIVYHFLEFEAGSTFVGAASAINVANGGAGPSINGLTGTNWIGFAAGQGSINAAIISVVWDVGTEAADATDPASGTDGYTYSLSYLADSVLSSASAGATVSPYNGVNLERLAFAVNVATSVPNTVGAIACEDGTLLTTEDGLVLTYEG